MRTTIEERALGILIGGKGGEKGERQLSREDIPGRGREEDEKERKRMNDAER